ncbi:MAG: CPBP family intramembrane metalloprotease [Verrucomicrobia bacterium]|nr:CPBP family intramembrane metalloprotease [Verrucomicrobiota bacterium]
MFDNPLIVVLMAAAAGYILKLWWDDLRAAERGEPNPKALPGATRASISWICIGIGGALLLVGIETIGEYALGVSDQQSTIPAWFLLAMIAAGIIEEIVFRGYLVVTGKGVAILWLSIVGFSLLFALLHYQYYLSWEEDAAWHQFSVDIHAKSIWTLTLLFMNSLWFYALRFMRQNQSRSLLPCFCAHIASNVGVFVVKAAQGHVTW